MDGEIADDGSRIRHSYVKGEVFEHFDEHGAVILQRQLCFFICKVVIVDRETRWITLTTFDQIKS
jgi:hypothetical protein